MLTRLRRFALYAALAYPLLTFSDHPTQSRTAAINCPALEVTMHGFYRAMRALIGNPVLNDTAGAVV